VIAGLNQKFLLAYDDEESGKERKTSMYFLVQANDVKEAFDNTMGIMQSTMGEYSIPAVSNLLWMFSLFFWRREKIWKNRKV
jgi:hypothetical protein